MEPEVFNRVYESIVKRESTYDGVYYTGVKTTKIVCRPSCRARTPKPENITLYRSVEEAVSAGFRPCKRCKPEVPGPHAPDASLAYQVDELIRSRLDEPLTLKALAALLAVSPYHLQRTYKRVTGYSPAERLQKLRLEVVQQKLFDAAVPITDIGGGVGFRSASHFAAWFRKETGLSPTEYRESCTSGSAAGLRGGDTV